jgi:hypothetical protein
LILPYENCRLEISAIIVFLISATLAASPYYTMNTPGKFR